MADATITVTLTEVAENFDPVQVEAHFKRVVASLANSELGNTNQGYNVEVSVA
jgi:hypothetical protein